MAWVYILRGGRRYYIGATDNLDRRVAEHQRGSNHTTHRFGAKLELVRSETVTLHDRSAGAGTSAQTQKESAARDFRIELNGEFK